jgi:uncharacterized protein (TIGR03437 family)
MVWATYLFGSSPESIAIDASENVWTTGLTASSTFPNSQGWSAGPEFLAGLNAAGSKLTYSARYPSSTVGQAVALDSSGRVHVAGMNGFIGAIAPTAAPGMTIFGFGNIAGGIVTARISPAEVISIFGPGIGPATAMTATPVSGFYPKTLAGVEVAINGIQMPLLYVSGNQINAVVPMGLTIGGEVTVAVTNGATTTPGYPVWAVGAAPQAFPGLLNEDGTLNSASNPAKAGSAVTFYATGWQSTFAGLADGQIATAAQDACAETCRATSEGLVNLAKSAVLYGGAAPGIVAGVTQFNVSLGTIPASAGLSEVSLILSEPSVASPPIYVRP